MKTLQQCLDGEDRIKSRTNKRDTFETHEPGGFVWDVRGPACELLALFLADKPVHALVAKHAFRAIEQGYSAYREERILKLLIEIATSYRLVSWRLSPEQKAKERRIQVGILRNSGSDTDIDLFMHEACNKIIHAEEFAFETRKLRKIALTYIKDDTIHAMGTKGRKEWSIALWIAEFCEAAIDMPFVDGIPF